MIEVLQGPGPAPGYQRYMGALVLHRALPQTLTMSVSQLAGSYSTAFSTQAYYALRNNKDASMFSSPQGQAECANIDPSQHASWPFHVQP